MYQKKDGGIPVPKDGILSKFVEKYPDLPQEIGKGVEKFGNCPSIVMTVPNTRFPTKFATFPVAPTSLRAEDPDNYVFQRLKGRFKPYTLLPGWTITPRSDVIEFSSFKLREIIKYYKLTKLVIPFEMFTFDREDKDDYTRVKTIMKKYLGSEVLIATHTRESSQGTITSSVSSSLTMDDDE